MTIKALKRTVLRSVQWLQRFADRAWYGPLLGVLGAVDMFALIVPSDGLLISSSMLTPRRWLSLAFYMAVGSTIGALALAAFVKFKGLPFVLSLYPGLDQTATWILTMSFFAEYGLMLVFAVAATPLMQQPTVIIAGLAGTPLSTLTATVFAGRLLKSLVLGYLASHAPGLLQKMWGVKSELEEVGVSLK